VGVLRVPEVIVCGHTDCGVMRGALNPEALEAYPNVTAWLRYAKVEQREPEPSAEFLLRWTEDNVSHNLETCAHIPRLRLDWNQGDLALHGWVYHIGPRTVTAYNEASRRFETNSLLVIREAGRSRMSSIRKLALPWGQPRSIFAPTRLRLASTFSLQRSDVGGHGTNFIVDHIANPESLSRF